MSRVGELESIFRSHCAADVDPIIVNYTAAIISQLAASTTMSAATVADELCDTLGPLLLDLGLSEPQLRSFIKASIDAQHASALSLKQSSAHNSTGPEVENPMLMALENPIAMSELNWIHLLRETSGLSMGRSIERVGRDGTATSSSVSLLSSQKLSLELLASKRSSGAQSLVDKDKLTRAELKLRLKQERRKEPHAPPASTNIVTGPAKQLASAGAMAIDESTLLQPLEKSRRSRDIKLERFDITINGKHIVTDGHLALPFGRRIGLVGRNGVGKSTLLRAISSRQLAVPKHVTILHVEQEVIGDDTPALASVLQADALREALLRRERECLRKCSELPDGPEKDVAADELKKIYDRLDEIESEKAESRACMILGGLGFSKEAQARVTRTFSGGWRMRLALARALFCRPDLLLLDEPTNMLDIPAVVWLATYLRSWTSTIFVVSHDRDFLDEICTDVVHLHHEQLDTYKGNYTQFLTTREERRKHYEKEYENNLQYRQHLQEFVDRWRYNAARAALAQSKLKILEKLPVLQPWPADPAIVLLFPEVEKLGPPIVQLDDVCFAYPESLPDGTASETRGDWLLRDVNFSLQLDSRVAIVGPNGAGKTTFLKLVTAALEPQLGRVFAHGRLRFAFFSQHHVDALDMNMNAIELLATKYPGRTEEEYRRHCGSFGLSGPLALQPIFTLSGGQKSRLVFTTMSLSYPHILVLDEPTNHLDVDSIDALIASLKEFGGGVVVVSHDARFVEAVCKDIWVCDLGTVSKYSGSIRDYVRSLPIEFPSL